MPGAEVISDAGVMLSWIMANVAALSPLEVHGTWKRQCLEVSESILSNLAAPLISCFVLALGSGKPRDDDSCYDSGEGSGFGHRSTMARAGKCPRLFFSRDVGAAKPRTRLRISASPSSPGFTICGNHMTFFAALRLGI